MTNRPGFSLIETLIYISLSSLFLVLLFQFSNDCYKRYKLNYKNYLVSCAALDLISRDLKKINTIKKVENNLIIFSTNAKDISWTIKNNKLYRIEGIFVNNNWTDKIESLVLYNCISLNFTDHKTSLDVELHIIQNNKVLKLTNTTFKRYRMIYYEE